MKMLSMHSPEKTFDFSLLPEAENARHEFKSSKIATDAISKKLQAAASAFWNSGGGFFILGVDEDTGQADGGIPSMIGRQPVRDWLDKLLHNADSVGPYDIHVLTPEDAPDATIDETRCVVAVEFGASHLAPHLAPNGVVYIRAGAHTAPATQFLADALWAKRSSSSPALVHVLRPKPNYQEAIQLGIVSIVDQPALDVEISLSKMPEMWKTFDSPFPLNVPLIDRRNPFFMDLTTFYSAAERVGEDVEVELKYHDQAGREYTYRRPVAVQDSLSPWRIGSEHAKESVKEQEKIRKVLEKIERKIPDERGEAARKQHLSQRRKRQRAEVKRPSRIWRLPAMMVSGWWRDR